MKYIADLHIHSRFSRATSQSSHLHGLAAWAAVKGIQLVGTGDFTHPGWFTHLHECLEPAEPGFFRLKPEAGMDCRRFLPEGIAPALAPEEVRFVLSAEISSIYKRAGRVRKVHNLLFAADFASVRRLNTVLAAIGNIGADGRPILGLDARDLLEILLEQAPEGFLVPAHVWTPWFSLFGSKSGFDTIEECFGDLSDHIFALETGLSSDPAMNRLVSHLDRFTLLSNSDCHSPAKLGREANIFTTGFDFFSMREAIRSPVDGDGHQVFAATIEFYPEEGKYHLDGHRKCGVCLEPAATCQAAGLCPACGKPLTIGVLHRVMELADRSQPLLPSGSPAVHSLIPLQEIVAELVGAGASSGKAVQAYAQLIAAYGSELGLLLDTPVEEIIGRGQTLLGEAIARVRNGRVIRRAGYDGEFGVIKVFAEGELAQLRGQGKLFAAPAASRRHTSARGPALPPKTTVAASPAIPARQLNPEQEQAVASRARRILVQAGPGTGKTHTLVSRIIRVAAESDLPCVVITFTNKAADEVRERLATDPVTRKAGLTVATFHGYCLAHLRRDGSGLGVVGPEERAAILEELFPDLGNGSRKGLSRRLGLFLANAATGAGETDPQLQTYLALLDQRQLIDLEAVVPRALALLRQDGEGARAMRAATGHLFIDEFQDVNEVQYRLVAELARTATVFAIGDPDQSIYAFRGSSPSWFHTFIRVFQPECHRLLRNYRSGALILRAAEALIACNSGPRPTEPMLACGSDPGVMYLQQAASPEGEAAFIADQVELQLGGTSHREVERIALPLAGQISFRDIGILYRTSRQAQLIGSALVARGIPFQLVDLEAFYTRGDCRLVYCWLLVLAGLAGRSQILTLLAGEEGMDRRCLQVAAACLGNGREGEDGPGTDSALPAAATAAIDRFRRLRSDLMLLAEAQPVAEVVQAIAGHYRLDAEATDLLRLRQLAVTLGPSLRLFTQYLHAYSDSVLYDQRAEAVTLSTLHAAKGLEFPVVFIAGLEEDLLPLRPRGQWTTAAAAEHLEEERRLFYVGMTRAISSLYLSWCAFRHQASGVAAARQRSRFLDEIPAASLSPPPRIGGSTRKKRPAHRQLPLFSRS